MALQVNVTAQGGVSVTNAYVRISEVTGYKNYADGKYYMTIGLKVLKNAIEAAKVDPPGVAIPVPTVDQEKCELSLVSTDNALVQAYAYLKTLAKFAGAVDV